MNVELSPPKLAQEEDWPTYRVRMLAFAKAMNFRNLLQQPKTKAWKLDSKQVAEITRVSYLIMSTLPDNVVVSLTVAGWTINGAWQPCGRRCGGFYNLNFTNLMNICVLLYARVASSLPSAEAFRIFIPIFLPSQKSFVPWENMEIPNADLFWCAGMLMGMKTPDPSKFLVDEADKATAPERYREWDKVCQALRQNNEDYEYHLKRVDLFVRGSASGGTGSQWECRLCDKKPNIEASLGKLLRAC